MIGENEAETALAERIKRARDSWGPRRSTMDTIGMEKDVALRLGSRLMLTGAGRWGRAALV